MSDFDKLGQDAYKVYTGLVKGGFIEPVAMGIVSQFIQHLYIQQIIREEQRFKILTENIK